MRMPVWKGAAKSLIIGVRKVYANRQAWRQMEQREKRIAGLGEFWALVREDLHYNGGILWPGFQALAVYRFGVWKDGIAAKPLRIPFTIVYRLAYAFVRNFYGIELPLTTRIGRRLLVGHQHGIIIHDNAVIGDDCVVRQGVTIGAGRADPRGLGRAHAGAEARQPGGGRGQRHRLRRDQRRRRRAHRAERGGDDQRAGRRHRHRAALAHHAAAEAQAEARPPRRREPAPEAAPAAGPAATTERKTGT